MNVNNQKYNNSKEKEKRIRFSSINHLDVKKLKLVANFDRVNDIMLCSLFVLNLQDIFLNVEDKKCKFSSQM